MFGEIDPLTIDSFFSANEMTLEFDIEMIGSEYRPQSFRDFPGRVSPPQEDNESGRKFLELLPADEAASFLAPQMRLGQKRTEILVAGAIFHQHREKGPIFHRELGAEKRANSLFAAGDGKSLRAIDAIAIEESECGEASVGGPLCQLFRERGAAEKTKRARRM